MLALFTNGVKEVLLETIKPQSYEDLVRCIYYCFDSSDTAVADAQLNIARPIADTQGQPSELWLEILARLRNLPWPIDPELSSFMGKEAAGLNRHFFGFDEAWISQASEAIDDGASWDDVVKSATCHVRQLLV